MDIKANRMDILRQVESGEMTLEEAARWLAALDRLKEKAAQTSDIQPEVEATPFQAEQMNSQPAVAEVAEPQVPPSPAQPQPAAMPRLVQPEVAPASRVFTPENYGSKQPEILPEAPPAPFWRGWWLLVFIPGLLLVLASVNWMYSGFLAAGLGWGFWLSFFPFGLGVVLLWLGWEIRRARWLYLRVRQRPGAHPQELRLSFPLPVGLLSWAVRRFGRFAGSVRGSDVGDLLQDLNQSMASDGPIHIFVDDPHGQQVEIWIDGPRDR